MEEWVKGGYTIVKDYVRERRRTWEMFVPLSQPPGHAQYDFGEALAVIGGVELKAHYFVLDLPHSDGCFVGLQAQHGSCRFPMWSVPPHECGILGYSLDCG